MVTSIPDDFARVADELVAVAKSIGGYLSAREVRFLALLAACPTAAGEILEIGTYKGKSTIVLTRAAQLAAPARVIAVDPFVLAGPDGPDAALAHLRNNLQRHGVADAVEFHQDYAAHLAREWTRPLRLLWIDGDHSYAAAKSDFDLFTPFLADGAIVAMHDVLNVADGPIRVFTEDVLLSTRFGAAGMCGSIGWAQFCADAAVAGRYRARRAQLYRRLSRLVPYVAYGEKVKGFTKMRYKFLRWRVPHRDVQPAHWLSAVAVRDA